MASTPLVDVAIDDTKGGIIEGIPASVSYANLLHTALPTLLEHYMNKVLEEHVEESRRRLAKDDDYRPLAQYYDVIQAEDEVGELVFDFFDLPPHLHAKATALEYGDATVAPRAFMRTTLFSDISSVFDELSDGINYSLGNLVVLSA